MRALCEDEPVVNLTPDSKDEEQHWVDIIELPEDYVHEPFRPYKSASPKARKKMNLLRHPMVSFVG